ncbi:serine/threonine-protein kinase AfsK [Streptomyces himastatinicus ATCC 53653]|uniref:Serine/threonine-protein kinase AfsK n=1 Tax=Streptomyces himastatinicus ATCC 53653 TaxID=457427 RepID=D9WSN9_9ACTN|nr:serine/threonine-protein kinase [Streptomyces himastatinicus]EFL24164.1 serine/threonine-protein kinase AfsK [Streptomyces himastatinicus ATCC 53653]
MQPLGAEDPQVIGAYRLLGRLGSGGMGVVYLGRSAGGRTVAVKVVHAQFALDEEFRARFRREVDAARRVGGSWTAPVLDADPEARVPWVATGYVAGPSLSQAINEEGPLPESSVRTLAAGLAEALDAVHGLGLVHRDVKPSNVLLALDGPRLIDFGIARATEGTVSLTSTGASIGSPGYMAPEQILGQPVTGPADIFSLGAVLTYAATGEQPFPGDSSASLLYKVVHEEPQLGPELTGELRDVVAECLAKNPADRPTPEQIARRLAPADGASGLVRSGWLPGALVERVSRQAVELLDLEAEAVAPPPAATETPASGTPASGTPVPASGTPASGTPVPVASPASAPMLGAFGPPPAYANQPSYGNQPGHGPGDPATPPPSRPSSGGGDAAGQQGGRGFALSAALGGKKRPKALSCSLVLSVAGALAIATTAVFLVQNMSGDPGGDTSADGGTSHTRPASPGASDSSGGSDVPKGFLGTWQGDLTSQNGIPVGTMTITFQRGSTGQQVASGRVKLSVVRCDFTWKLISATQKELHLDARFRGDGPRTGCSDSSTDEQYTLGSDGTLKYRAKDRQAGDPTGTLRRLR